MKNKPLSEARAEDLVNSLAAMQRAARMAREQAVRTDTAIVIMEDGKLVRITAEELRRAGTR